LHHVIPGFISDRVFVVIGSLWKGAVVGQRWGDRRIYRR
jgi:hypothetical protein